MIAQCYSNLGKKSDAAQLLEVVIKGDEGNGTALYEYSKIALDFGKHEDSLTILLRCIVIKEKDDKVKKAVTEALNRPGGIDLLHKTFKLTNQTHAAYAFLSNVVRDHGAVVLSKDLLALCVGQQRGNASYALAYIHARELLQDHDGAWASVKFFLENVGRGGDGVGCKDFLEIIRECDCWGKVGGEGGELKLAR